MERFSWQSKEQRVEKSSSASSDKDFILLLSALSHIYKLKGHSVEDSRFSSKAEYERNNYFLTI